jgi:hypothetical protein
LVEKPLANVGGDTFGIAGKMDRRLEPWCISAFVENPAHVPVNIVAAGHLLGVNVASTVPLAPDHFAACGVFTSSARSQAVLLCQHRIPIKTVDLYDSGILVTSIGFDAESLLHRAYFAARASGSGSEANTRLAVSQGVLEPAIVLIGPPGESDAALILIAQVLARRRGVRLGHTAVVEIISRVSNSMLVVLAFRTMTLGKHPAQVPVHIVTHSNFLGVNVAAPISLVPDHFAAGGANTL